MNKSLLVILSLVAGSASAAGFSDFESAPVNTCYSWEGGYKSSGSYMHCGAPLVTTRVVQAPVAEAKPVIVQPIMTTTNCPPPVVLEREPSPVKKALPKPKKARHAGKC